MDYKKEWEELKSWVEMAIEKNEKSHLKGMPFELASNQELANQIETNGLLRGMRFIRDEMDFADGTIRNK